MKKILIISFLLLYIVMYGMASTYTSQYPSSHDADHVKSTNFIQHGEPYRCTNPGYSLTGSWSSTSWLSSVLTEQRFHIDLDSAKIIRRIYYENNHYSGGATTVGAQNFTFWGSNTEASFLELNYGTDTGWTQLTTSQATFDQHIGADQADPKYATVTNTTAYQYYAFKFADNHGYGTYIGVRRIELQTEDGYSPFALAKFNNVTITKWNELAITKWNNKNIP